MRRPIRLLPPGFIVCLASAVAFPTSAGAASPTRAEIRVGIDEGDIRGSDHRALQAAVDYVAGLGGGTVYIGPGRYEMRNALKLRDNVTIVGVPEKSVLVACDGFSTPLAADGDCNERQITVADPSGFRIGDGISVQCRRTGGGFAVTTATIVSQSAPDTFQISHPLYLDYMVRDNATAKLAFPVVGGWNIKNAVVEGLTIDGNREKAEYLNGCRGGGIFLFECEQVVIRNCIVRNYNGDGVSFQVSQHITVEDCLVENHFGLGLHPGSGSQHPIIRRNRSIGNGQDGLYVCWRVKHGLFEENEIRGNKRVGISIGHKDSDNVFRRNIVIGNDGAGLLFRNETEAMGAHRNVFEHNRILDNARSASGGGQRAAVVIQGTHHDLVFRDNVIGNSEPGSGPKVGILLSPDSKNLTAAESQFQNVEKAIETRERPQGGRE